MSQVENEDQRLEESEEELSSGMQITFTEDEEYTSVRDHINMWKSIIDRQRCAMSTTDAEDGPMDKDDADIIADYLRGALYTSGIDPDSLYLISIGEDHLERTTPYTINITLNYEHNNKKD